MEKYDKFIAAGGVICYNIMARRLSQFKSGGRIECAIYPTNYECLRSVIEQLDGFTLIGGGNNLLFTDKTYTAPVVSTRKCKGMSADGLTIETLAGDSIAELTAFCVENGLGGAERLSGIPATLGGAAVMNAGAYGAQMSDIVEGAEVYRNGEYVWLSNSDLRYGYRSSVLLKSGYVLTKLRLRMTKSTKSALKDSVREILSKRKNMFPAEPSLGCTFKKSGVTGAGELIDRAGLKGYAVGGARISEKHAGFIINAGGATSSDYAELAEYAKECVLERFGINLEREVIYIGID